jgi:hypothetical protein
MLTSDCLKKMAFYIVWGGAETEPAKFFNGAAYNDAALQQWLNLRIGAGASLQYIAAAVMRQIIANKLASSILALFKMPIAVLLNIAAEPHNFHAVPASTP